MSTRRELEDFLSQLETPPSKVTGAFFDGRPPNYYDNFDNSGLALGYMFMDFHHPDFGYGVSFWIRPEVIKEKGHVIFHSIGCNFVIDIAPKDTWGFLNDTDTTKVDLEGHLRLYQIDDIVNTAGDAHSGVLKRMCISNDKLVEGTTYHCFFTNPGDHPVYNQNLIEDQNTSLAINDVWQDTFNFGYNLILDTLGGYNTFVSTGVGNDAAFLNCYSKALDPLYSPLAVPGYMGPNNKATHTGNTLTQFIDAVQNSGDEGWVFNDNTTAPEGFLGTMFTFSFFGFIDDAPPNTAVSLEWMFAISTGPNSLPFGHYESNGDLVGGYDDIANPFRCIGHYYFNNTLNSALPNMFVPGPPFLNINSIYGASDTPGRIYTSVDNNAKITLTLTQLIKFIKAILTT